eukprot:6188678-Pleurochrysis_carterae.AAC.2
MQAAYQILDSHSRADHPVELEESKANILAQIWPHAFVHLPNRQHVDSKLRSNCIGGRALFITLPLAWSKSILRIPCGISLLFSRTIWPARHEERTRRQSFKSRDQCGKKTCEHTKVIAQP